MSVRHASSVAFGGGRWGWIIATGAALAVAAGCVGGQVMHTGTSAAPPTTPPGNTTAAPPPQTPATSSPPPTTSPAPPPSTQPQPATLAWGPTQEEVDKAIADAAALPLEQAAGMVIIARYSGANAQTAVDMVTKLHLGGIILFSENITSKDQVLSATKAIADAATQDGRDWPAAIGVDQEGGSVQRLGDPWTQLPDFQTAGAASGTSTASPAVQAAYQASGTELRAAGFTMDFAPDADVTIGAKDPTIGSRSAGSDPARVSQAVQAAVAGYEAGGVLPSIKHFPGHGSVTTNSHTSLPVQDASIDELAARDFIPFADAIKAGAPMVMVGHIDVTAWGTGLPASLDPHAYAYLRDTLGFTGVTITDGLDMQGVTAGRTTGQIAVDAINAGADVLLTPDSASDARQGLIGAVNGGTLSRDRLNQAAGHFIALMRYQATLAAQAGPAGADQIGAHADESRALSAAGVTVLTGQCSGPLVGSSIHLRGGTKAQWQAFSDAATRAGLTITPLEQPAPTNVRLLQDDTTSGSGDVVIALGQPYPLASSDAKVKVALYGDTPEAFDAVIAVLLGKAPAPGTVPVAVGSTPIGTGCS